MTAPSGSAEHNASRYRVERDTAGYSTNMTLVALLALLATRLGVLLSLLSMILRLLGMILRHLRGLLLLLRLAAGPLSCLRLESLP